MSKALDKHYENKFLVGQKVRSPEGDLAKITERRKTSFTCRFMDPVGNESVVPKELWMGWQPANYFWETK